MNRNLLIGDLIEVPPVQTVIRLEEGRTRSESIAKNFVFTSDVTSHFAVLADSLLKDHGRGFFLQGDFGSGKSHFLAALTAWLSNYPGADVICDHHGGLRRVKESGRRFLPVDISLVNYRSTTPLERIIVEAIEKALTSQGIEVRLTPLAVFLSNLKTLLKSKELSSFFAEQLGISPDDIDEYLLEHPRQSYTEGVRFMKSLGMKAPETLVEERYETFERVANAVKEAGFNGLVLVVDELSEFFRSKTDARALNEDARTLQLIGELTRSEPVWIIAAVQESIERTGDISQVTFQKIKDRFPVKFILSTVHIKALISERLVKKKPGADQEIHSIYEYFRSQFPSFNWLFEDFRTTYPVHPVTISLLDGLGDLFSEHRGIVDFVHSRLAGDKSRLISGILDRPCYELLGPDSIYEHFSQKMAEFTSFNIFPRHIVPHLDEVIENSIDELEDRFLARRIIRILVLYSIHPTADTPTVKEMTELVACALSEQDPAINVQFVAEAILDLLVENSKFIVKHPSKTKDPLDVVYTVETEEDPGKTLKARILRAASEIPFDDTRLLTTAFSELPESMSWPGSAVCQQGVYLTVTWQHSKRLVFVTFLGTGEEASVKNRLAGAFSSGDADFAIVISIGKTGFKMEHTAVWEIPVSFDNESIAILREYLATKNISLELKPSNPSDAPLINAAKEAVLRLMPGAHQAALKIFYTGNYTDARIKVEPMIRNSTQFGRLLDIAGELLLEERYPGYKEIAPRKVSPLPLLYQRLIDEFVSPGSLSLNEARSRGLNDAIEGLAMPLGLAELRSGSYILAPDPENHPLISVVFRLIGTAGRTKLTDVLFSLRTGRFGIPFDVVFFLLAALAHGGLITLIKNERAMPLEFLRLSGVKNADAIAPGEVIGKHDRETLVSECTFLAPSDGWESFGLRQQREAWQGVVKFKDWAQKTMIDMEKRLTSIAEFSAFEAFDLHSLRSRLNVFKTLSDEIKVSFPAREGLERFLKTWRGTGFTYKEIDFIKKMRMFLTRQAEHFVFVNHYIRHTAVDRAGSEDREIEELKNRVMELLDHPDFLVMEDDTSLLTDVFDRFRTVYAKYYIKKHGEHYKMFKKKALSRFAKRALALLKRLASIDILDRPPGLESLFRELEAPDVMVCTRNLAEELMRSPVCNCGFIHGEILKPVQKKDPEETIEKCLDEYLVILKNPGVREAISARIFALADADPDTVKRLRSLNAYLEDENPSSSALLDLMDDITAGEISRALSGRVKIERRDLKDLYSHLGGRRLAPNQVFETVKEWICTSAENTVIAIEDDYDVSPGTGTSSVSWWMMMHPVLFKEDASLEIRSIESALELQFPAIGLRNPLKALDDDKLAGFLKDEPFHTDAIRMAWLLFSERVLLGKIRSGTIWPNQAEPNQAEPGQVESGQVESGQAERGQAIPEQAKIYSKHVDPEIATGIKKRLSVLKRIASLLNASHPDTLRVRIPLSEILVDSWATNELQSLARDKIGKAVEMGKEWLSMLSPVEPVSLSDNPIVVILDGISPDVWLETMDRLKCDVGEVTLSWSLLKVVPKTAPSVSALFGFSGDAMDEFAARDIFYHQVKGNESHGIKDLLPAFAPDKPVVIRIALVDAGAHAGLLRLFEMPGAVCRFLENELPNLLDICADRNRRLVMTTDHGFSLTRTGLSHGKGGVFERAVFRAEWKWE